VPFEAEQHAVLSESACCFSGICTEGLIKTDDISIRAYNLQVFIERTIAFVLIFTVAAVLGYLLEVVIFVISFASIRSYSGGYHCKTFLGCLGVSVATIIASVPMAYFLERYHVVYFSLLMLSALFIIVVGSLGDPEADYSEETNERVKRLGRLLCMFMTSSALLTYVIKPTESLSFYIGTGVIQVAFYLIIAIIQHEGRIS